MGSKKNQDQIFIPHTPINPEKEHLKQLFSTTIIIFALTLAELITDHMEALAAKIIDEAI